jgi:hypothetical protein
MLPRSLEGEIARQNLDRCPEAIDLMDHKNQQGIDSTATTANANASSI